MFCMSLSAPVVSLLECDWMGTWGCCSPPMVPVSWWQSKWLSKACDNLFLNQEQSNDDSWKEDLWATLSALGLLECRAHTVTMKLLLFFAFNLCLRLWGNTNSRCLQNSQLHGGTMMKIHVKKLLPCHSLCSHCTNIAPVWNHKHKQELEHQNWRSFMKAGRWDWSSGCAAQLSPCISGWCRLQTHHRGFKGFQRVPRRQTDGVEDDHTLTPYLRYTTKLREEWMVIPSDRRTDVVNCLETIGEMAFRPQLTCFDNFRTTRYDVQNYIWWQWWTISLFCIRWAWRWHSRKGVKFENCTNLWRCEMTRDFW